ncbi:MAG: EpsI family protein [Desulfosarcina sp.]|nr:EpsI family protein [Desulfobacterales bacterium]
MESLKNRYIIIIILIALSAFTVKWLTCSAYQNTEAGIQAIKGIPLDFGSWQGKDVPLEDRIYELLETKFIIHRIYHADNGNEVFLSIVHHPETKVNFHGPEQCLGAQGIALEQSLNRISFISGNKTVEINLNRLIQKRYGKESLYFYFFKAGDFMGPNYIKLRLNLAMNKFTNSSKSGSLIRISTPVSDDNTQKAGLVLTDFIKDLYPYFIKYL